MKGRWKNGRSQKGGISFNQVKPKSTTVEMGAKRCNFLAFLGLGDNLLTTCGQIVKNAKK